jgi:hypothetical protein
VAVVRATRWLRILAAVLGGTLALWAAQGDTDGAEFIASCVIDHHESTWDSRGTQFFELRCGGEQGAFTVAIDRDLPLSKYLATHHKARVSVALGSSQ